jgi:hypothetical protein
VRGYWLAWLYWSGSWFYDSWNGLTSSCLQKSSGHYHLFHDKHLAWCLPIILIHETYLLLSSTLLRVLQPSAHHADTPIQHSLSFFYAMHMALSDYVQHVERNKVFTIDYPLTKCLRHIVEITPIIFFLRYFKWPLEGSNVLEQTFVNDGWFHSHLPFCTPLFKLHVSTVGRGWQWCIKVYFISISSHSIQDWLVTFFIPPSRFDLMILSLIFGWLKVLSVLSARRDWSVCALDDVIRKRSFDHTFCLSELGEVPVDNHSKRHSFRFCSPLKVC